MPENTRRPTNTENILNMEKDGFYGKFGSGGNVEVSFIQSVMDFHFLNEISLIEGIKGSDQWNVRDLFQRNVDKQRVNKEIIPFLRDKSSTKFFAPLVLVLLPMNGKQVDNTLVEIQSTIDNDGISRHKIGDYIEFEEFNNAAYSKVKWNRQKIKLVAVDGQHRVTALTTILNDNQHDPLVDSMKIPVLIVGFSKSKDSYESNHVPLLLDEVRKTFVYINNKSQKINESRAILLDNEDINSIAVQEVVQIAHDNDKELNEKPSGIPLSLFDWLGEEKNGKPVPGPASLFSVRDLKDWFIHYIFGDKNNEKTVRSRIIPRLDLDHQSSRIPPDKLSGLNHEYSEIARQQFKDYLLPSIIYVLENLNPLKNYINSIRDVQKKTEAEMDVYGRYAYKWICFGKSEIPSQHAVEDVNAAYDMLRRDLRGLKEVVPTLLLKDIGIRAIWSSYSILYELKCETSQRPDWLEFSKWYVKLANEVIADGWFIGIDESPTLKADFKKKLTHIVYGKSEDIVNYRPERASKAFGAFMAILILKKHNDKELTNTAWDSVKDDLIATVKTGFLKDTKDEMDDFNGTPAQIKAEKARRVAGKIDKWEKSMNLFFEISE